MFILYYVSWGIKEEDTTGALKELANLLIFKFQNDKTFFD